MDLKQFSIGPIKPIPPYRACRWCGAPLKKDGPDWYVCTNKTDCHAAYNPKYVDRDFVDADEH